MFAFFLEKMSAQCTCTYTFQCFRVCFLIIVKKITISLLLFKGTCVIKKKECFLWYRESLNCIAFFSLAKTILIRKLFFVRSFNSFRISSYVYTFFILNSKMEFIFKKLHKNAGREFSGFFSLSIVESKLCIQIMCLALRLNSRTYAIVVVIGWNINDCSKII